MINHDILKTIVGYTLISISIFGFLLALNYLFSWGWFEGGFSIPTRAKSLLLDDAGGYYSKGEPINITSGVFIFYGLCAIAGCLLLAKSNRN